jgi:hypothetical protein
MPYLIIARNYNELRGGLATLRPMSFRLVVSGNLMDVLPREHTDKMIGATKHANS